MSMVSDPEQFLREKLQKRYLSINTVRDGILASMILTLQRAEEIRRGSPPGETWRQECAAALRLEMTKLCEAHKIPTEYPNLEQLNDLRSRMEEQVGINRLDRSLRDPHNDTSDRLLAKAQE